MKTPFEEKIKVLVRRCYRFAVSLRKRLLDLLRFLAFKEPQPKRGTIIYMPLWLLVLLAFSPFILGYIVFRYVFISYGLVATILSILGVSLAWLETLHILCDR